MSDTFKHLGEYSDLVAAVNKQYGALPWAKPGPETQAHVRECLHFSLGAEQASQIKLERSWEKDGVAGELLSWNVGYGPRTEAYVLKPVGATGRLPGILALHDHGGFKVYGKEKIAEGPDDLPEVLVRWRDVYGNRSYANALAKEGYVVLVPDTFLWGSRKFALETMPDFERMVAELGAAASQREGVSDEYARYNLAASLHEHLVEKYCNVLGTTLSGIISYEDRVAANYLYGRSDVQAQHIGCLGLSGGGLRSTLLQATCDHIKAAVVVGLMSSYPGLLDHNVASHTWMLYPDGWARYGDWPDLAACRAPSPLLVQYDNDDPLFTLEGMHAADDRLKKHYKSVGHLEAYEGQFYPGEHKFDLEMQSAAFAWLAKWLKG